MPKRRILTKNRLLDAFPVGALASLSPHLEQIPMSPGDVLYESGRQLEYVYFPVIGIVSLRKVLANGQVSEVAVVGDEGMLGISIFLGDGPTFARAVVEGEGVAYRVNAQRFKEEFNREGPVQRLVLRYTQTVITQMAQAAACNQHHSIDQHFCRLLLESLDRLPTNTLTMTQGQIAARLSVRRERISEAAGRLGRAGVIRTQHHGAITVLDRHKLERAACECYTMAKLAFNRLFRDSPRGELFRMTR